MSNPYALTVDEVARLLRVGKGSVYRLARTGELPSYRVGRKLRFAARDISAYMTAVGQANEPSPEEGTGLAVLSASEAFPLDGQRPFLIAGSGPVTGLLVDMLGEGGLPVAHARSNGYTALVNLYAGIVDAAVVCLYDRKTNSYNAAYARRIAPGTPMVLVRLHRVDQGFMVVPGNPCRIRTWASLLKDGVRLANRERGSSARVLLDEKLSALEADPQSLVGYRKEFSSSAACASEILCGSADVALGNEQDAMDAGLDFVPLQRGWVDVAFAKTERTAPLVRAAREMTAKRPFAERLAGLGYDASRAGSIVFEC